MFLWLLWAMCDGEAGKIFITEPCWWCHESGHQVIKSIQPRPSIYEGAFSSCVIGLHLLLLRDRLDSSTIGLT